MQSRPERDDSSFVASASSQESSCFKLRARTTKAPLRKVLPRETAVWLQVPVSDMLSRIQPRHPGSQVSQEGATLLLEEPEVRPARSRRRRCSAALMLSYVGMPDNTFFRHADAALTHLAGPDDLEMIDDAHWEYFPEVCDALSRLAEKRECFVVAFCRKQHTLGIGVGMGTACRRLAAKAALAIAMALNQRRGGSIVFHGRWQSLLHLAEEAEANRPGVRWWRWRGLFRSLRFPSLLPFPTQWNWSRRPPWLSIRTSCEGGMEMHAEPGRRRGSHCSDVWEGFCACCKRPLKIALEDPPPKRQRCEGERCEEGKYAYVCTLWGSKPQDTLGALVLGQSLRRHNCRQEPYDMLVLHTFDVPEESLECLRAVGWKTQQIRYVHASSALFSSAHSRFESVFTKLRALELVTYSKILLMDVDLLVRRNIDGLFKLPAPAAMHRGAWNGYKHGQRMDGKAFFAGAVGHSPWGQGTGINAGVMLLEPDPDVFDHMLAEVSDDHHPSHVQGAGPEQDYLSRFYASDWTHISVEYNFQLHQMYFALGIKDPLNNTDCAELLTDPERMISVFHYSGDPKPWCRLLTTTTMSEDEWLQQVQKNFRGYQAWVEKDPWAVENEVGHVGGFVNKDGNLAFKWEAPTDTDEKQEVYEEVWEVERWAIEGADWTTRLALREWEEVYGEVNAIVAAEVAEKLGRTKMDFSVALFLQEKENERKNQEDTWWPEQREAAAEGDQHDDWERERDPHKERWYEEKGWWRDTDPCKGRCTVSATVFPEASAVMIMGDSVISHCTGYGLHVAAAPGKEDDQEVRVSTRSFFDADDWTLHEVEQWADSVPPGARVFLAVVRMDETKARALLLKLSQAGFGCPRELPEGCAVCVAVGINGVGSLWPDTHASSDVAYVCHHAEHPK